MTPMIRAPRCLLWLAFGLFAAFPRVGTATPLDPVTAQCVRSFDEAQKLRRTGQLINSRQQLRQCANAQCPLVIAEKCVQWFREVDQALPTIIVVATDPAGNDTAEVRVSVDGKLVAERLDGRPWPIDPGPRLLRFEHRSGKVLEKRLLLTQTHKNRRIKVDFSTVDSAKPSGTPAQTSDPRKPDPPDRPRRLSPLIYAGFSIAGAGLLVGTITGVVALNKIDGIKESCAEGLCPTEQQDEFRQGATIAHVSTISFITAGAGAAMGLLGLLTTDWSDDNEQPVGFKVQPLLGPTVIGLRGVF